MRLLLTIGLSGRRSLPACGQHRSHARTLLLFSSKTQQLHQRNWWRRERLLRLRGIADFPGIRRLRLFAESRRSTLKRFGHQSGSVDAGLGMEWEVSGAG